MPAPPVAVKNINHHNDHRDFSEGWVPPFPAKKSRKNEGEIRHMFTGSSCGEPNPCFWTTSNRSPNLPLVRTVPPFTPSTPDEAPMRLRSAFDRIFALSLPLALLAIVPANPAAAQESGVRAGDKVTIDFYTAAGNQLSEITGERIVNRDGELFLPFVGTVHVRDLTAREIRELLTERFSAFFSDPVVEVTVKIKVNVTGAVARAGSFFLDPSSTVIDALSGAGGTGTGLDLRGIGSGAPDAKNVRLVRDGVTRILNLDPIDGNRVAIDMPIQSGDWLHVPPMPRSRTRENIQFWGTLVSLTAGVIGLIIAVSG